MTTATARVLSSLAHRLAKTFSHQDLPNLLSDLCEAEPMPVAEHPCFAHAARVWGLSAWELDLLTLTAARELDSDFTPALAAIGPLTVELAMKLHGIRGPQQGFARAAVLPGAPLRRLAILEVRPDGVLSLVEGLWARLAGLPEARPCVPIEPIGLLSKDLHLQPRTRAQLSEIPVPPPERPLLAFILGEAGSGRHATARALAGELGLSTLRVDGARLPDLAAQVERDARWWSCAIVVDGPSDAETVLQLEQPALWILPPGVPRPSEIAARRTVVRVDVLHLDATARHAVWRGLLGDRPDLETARMARRFRLGPGRTAEAVARARQRGPLTTDLLARCCDEVASAAFGPLAQRIESPASWGDLIIGEAVQAELMLAIAWLDQGERVFEQWGMGRALTGGLGLVALLGGPPGTGKTLAARVLANELGMQLWRVDLSRTVDKYIGETEKNLGRIFDAAREGNVLLMFDEAETVFGKRTEVHDAHDRHANLETGYLLQRLEEHDGPVVLATNLPQNLDDAFQRRIHVVARFELPDRHQRKAIWALHLPVERHRSGPLDLDLLAGFEIAGGDIRNAAVAGALLAASEDSGFTMAHAVRGLVREIRKSGRMVDLSRFGPWRDAI